MADAPLSDPRRCTGCGRCVSACPYHLLSLEPLGHRKIVIRESHDNCAGCHACVDSCPFGVMRI
jgi:ferredoxin